MQGIYHDISKKKKKQNTKPLKKTIKKERPGQRFSKKRKKIPAMH
jgi:hypothetical protein